MAQEQSRASRLAERLKHSVICHCKVTSTALLSIARDDGLVFSDILELNDKVRQVKNRDLARTAGNIKNSILASLVCCRKSEVGSTKEFQIFMGDYITRKLDQNNMPDYGEEVKRTISDYECNALKLLMDLEEKKLCGEHRILKDMQEKLEANHDLIKNFYRGTEHRGTIQKLMHLEGWEIDDDADDDQVKRSAQTFSRNMVEELWDCKFLIDKCKKHFENFHVLGANPEDFRIGINSLRGHSEDYLHLLLCLTNFLEDSEELQSTEFDIYCLVISSTRESCKRCHQKLEEMVDALNRAFNPSMSVDKVCKSLYFSCIQIKDVHGGAQNVNYFDAPSNLNVLEARSEKVIHFKPSAEQNFSTRPSEVFLQERSIRFLDGVSFESRALLSFQVERTRLSQRVAGRKGLQTIAEEKTEASFQHDARFADSFDNSILSVTRVFTSMLTGLARTSRTGSDLSTDAAELPERDGAYNNNPNHNKSQPKSSELSVVDQLASQNKFISALSKSSNQIAPVTIRNNLTSVKVGARLEIITPTAPNFSSTAMKRNATLDAKDRYAAQLLIRKTTDFSARSASSTQRGRLPIQFGRGSNPSIRFSREKDGRIAARSHTCGQFSGAAGSSGLSSATRREVQQNRAIRNVYSQMEQIFQFSISVPRPER